MALVEFFYEIGQFFDITLWLLFRNVGRDSEDIPLVGGLLKGWFYDIADICEEIGRWFYKVSGEAEVWWAKITQIAGDIGDLAAYAWGWLTDKAQEAFNLAGQAIQWATDAWDKAKDTWEYAVGWLTDRANEAWSRAGEIWGSVTNWLKDKAIEAYNKAVWAYEQIEAAVTAKAQEIYAWVKAIPGEIAAFVNGVVADIQAILTELIHTLINNALASIAAPINLINTWFDAIQNFFNDPLGSILSWLEGIASKHETRVLGIVDKVMDALWR